MFNLIGAIFSGLFIGARARFFYPGDVDMGWGMTILLGIGGSLLAGFVGNGFSFGKDLNRAPAGCLSSVLGAALLIFIGRQMGWHF
jgi:uncharacterized membrane protein YeaQ/YmgE (transglycosylase-associated protein family)